MIIKEFLPNPAGKDSQGEYIKLFNDEDRAVNLNGWRIKDESGKQYLFNNFSLRPNEELTLDYKATGITLNNNGENIYLLDAEQNLIDQIGFSGLIKEGEIVIKKDASILEQFPEPTEIIISSSPFYQFWILIRLTAAILALSVIYIVKSFNLLSDEKKSI